MCDVPTLFSTLLVHSPSTTLRYLLACRPSRLSSRLPLGLQSHGTSTLYHHLQASSLYLPYDPLCLLMSDSFHHLYEFWLGFHF